MRLVVKGGLSGTYMNNIERKRKVWSSAGDILKERNYISPVDLLMKLGVLSMGS